jgi:hypothetical protein
LFVVLGEPSSNLAVAEPVLVQMAGTVDHGCLATGTITRNRIGLAWATAKMALMLGSGLLLAAPYALVGAHLGRWSIGVEGQVHGKPVEVENGHLEGMVRCLGVWALAGMVAIMPYYPVRGLGDQGNSAEPLCLFYGS